MVLNTQQNCRSCPGGKAWICQISTYRGYLPPAEALRLRAASRIHAEGEGHRHSVPVASQVLDARWEVYHGLPTIYGKFFLGKMMTYHEIWDIKGESWTKYGTMMEGFGSFGVPNGPGTNFFD